MGFVLLAPLQACVPLGYTAPNIAGLERGDVTDPAGRRVAYLASGQPSTRRVIYVHGTPGDASAFADYLRDTPAGVRSISVDRPGFGRTGGVVVRSFEEQAAALEPLLGPAGDPPAVLVGHSLGGPIVARAAADYPERVGAIVIVAGSLDPGLENPRWFNYAGAAFGPVLPRTLRISNREIFAAPEQTRLLAGVLHRVRCPVVIVHGTRDSLVPFANVAYMRGSLTAAATIETRTIVGGDHFIVWTHRRAVADAVRRARQLADEADTADGADSAAAARADAAVPAQTTPAAAAPDA